MNPKAGRSSRVPTLAIVTAHAPGGPFVRIARSLAAGLHELGEPVEIVFLEAAPAGATASDPHEVWLGCRRASRCVSALTAYFRRRRPAAALVMPGYLSPFALFAGRRVGTPVVPWEGAFLGREVAGAWGRMRAGPLLQRLTYRWAPFVAVTSMSVGDYLKEKLRLDDDRMRVLPNPVDLDAVRAHASNDETARGTYFVSLGNLVAYKDHALLLRALHQADEDLIDWTMTLIGDGPERTHLEALARELGIDEKIEFAGYVRNPFRMLSAATALVHPSRFEGFGVALVEALALGVPVVATDSGGPAEILDGGRYGLLVPPGDVHGLATALVRIANDESLRHRLKASSGEAAARYGPRAIAERVLGIFEGEPSRYETS